jgi:hypothetical protein
LVVRYVLRDPPIYLKEFRVGHNVTGHLPRWRGVWSAVAAGSMSTRTSYVGRGRFRPIDQVEIRRHAPDRTGPDPYKFPYTGSVLATTGAGAGPAMRGSVEGCEASGFVFEVRMQDVKEYPTWKAELKHK